MLSAKKFTADIKRRRNIIQFTYLAGMNACVSAGDIGIGEISPAAQNSNLKIPIVFVSRNIQKEAMTLPVDIIRSKLSIPVGAGITGFAAGGCSRFNRQFAFRWHGMNMNQTAACKFAVM